MGLQRASTEATHYFTIYLDQLAIVGRNNSTVPSSNLVEDLLVVLPVQRQALLQV